MLSRDRRIRFIPALSLIVALLVTPSFPQDSTTAADTATLDSTFPEKRRAREPWEYVVSAPLWIVTGPLYLVYRGVSGTIGFVDDRHIVDKIQRVLVSKDETRKINPDYSSATGFGVSVTKGGLFTSGSRLRLTGRYGTLHRHAAELELAGLGLVRDNLLLDFDLTYNHVPDEPFFGIGANNDKSDEMDFGYFDVLSLLALRLNVRSVLNIYVAGAFDYYATVEGDNDDVPSVESRYAPDSIPPGFDSKSLLSGAMGGVRLDTRDRTGRTLEGTLLEAYVGFKKELRGINVHDEGRTTVFGLQQVAVDLSQYVHMPWSTGRVLVLRGALQSRNPLDGTEIPTSLLSELGSDETIRGFSRGRFRDRDCALLSVEYRYPVWEDIPNVLDAVFFVDAGEVAQNLFGGFDRKNIHVGYGGGFRFYDDGDLAAKISFGFSRDDFRVGFALGEESLTRVLKMIRKYSAI